MTKAKLRRPSAARNLLDPEFDDHPNIVERDVNPRTSEDSTNTHRPTRRTRLDAIWAGTIR